MSREILEDMVRGAIINGVASKVFGSLGRLPNFMSPDVRTICWIGFLGQAFPENNKTIRIVFLNNWVLNKAIQGWT